VWKSIPAAPASKHYNLESELKVGNRGTPNHIVEGMQDFDKVVWV